MKCGACFHEGPCGLTVWERSDLPFSPSFADSYLTFWVVKVQIFTIIWKWGGGSLDVVDVLDSLFLKDRFLVAGL